tara:strand:- start:624 stop:1877 length:1254 start_codon:yes stop_codon:yes gene_type:complete
MKILVIILLICYKFIIFQYYMKYPIIFKDLGLKNIYSLINNINQDGGVDNLNDSPSGIDVINKPLSLDNELFEEFCKDYEKLPHILPVKKRIICLGDLHGDYKLTLDCLKLANIIDDKLNWVAEPKDTVVVQIGDQIDRCRPEINKKCDNPDTTPFDEASDIKILEFFTDLHKKAKKKGGAVYSLLGNHEILNVIGNMSYVSYEGMKQFENEINPDTNKKFESGKEARKYLFKKGNKFSKFLACTRQTALIIGSNLFVHAAIVPDLAKKYKVDDLNFIVRKWLLDLINDEDKLEGIGKVSDIMLNYNISPFWPRVLGNLPKNLPLEDDACVEFLTDTLQLLNCNNMIVGHTPQPFTKSKSGINVTCRDEKSGVSKGVWRVDVGASLGFDNFKNNKIRKFSKAQVLEILNDNEFKVLG